MHQNLERADNLEPHGHGNDSYSISSRPWWRGVQHDAISLGALAENATKASQLKHLNCSLETTISKAEDNGGREMGTDANTEMQVTAVSQAENGKCEERIQSQHPTNVMPPSMGEYLTSPSQLDLVGHSVAHAKHPYSGPYYGDVMLAYQPHALVHPHCFGAHGNRMALPLEMAEDPVYVNAKQYHGILRRRQSRAKAELEKKLIKVRKPYLHESRHLHAMRRARGCGGRFLNTKKAAADGASDKAASSAESVSTHSSTSPNPSTHQDLMKSYEKEMNQQQPYSNGNSLYPQHQGFQMSAYHLMSDKRGEGNFLGKRRHRALTIQ